MRRFLPVAITFATVGWLGYLWWGRWSDASLAVWIGSSLAIGAALAAAIVPPDRARAHVAIAGALHLILAGFAATRAVGRWPFEWDSFGDPRYAGFIAATGILVGLGLVRGALWARWAAIAFCVGAILTGALNSIHMLGQRTEPAWLAAVGVVGGATILSQLTRPSVRELFARRSQHAVWSSRDALVTTARWAAIANLAAAPMLLLYAFGQPLAPQTATSAIVLAPLLLLGSLLVVARRAAGIAILGLGGLGLLAHTAWSAHLVARPSLPMVGYYATLWLPAAILGVVAAVLATIRTRHARRA